MIPIAAPPIAGLVGESRPMRDVVRLLRAAAASDVTVLIEGETGTGKELVARALAALGPRRDRPFVAVNCGAVAESMLDAELFGHRHGAFTGAHGDRPGLLESADGGTLFLDEVTSMSAGFQARLLRVLENAETRRVGSDRPRHVDLRVVAAGNQPLEERVRAGQFRADLFYRLSVFPIVLPPLRERRDDIPLLVEAFLAGLRRAGRTQVRGVAPAALARLVAADYPGNVRQLKNEVVRASTLAGASASIEVTHLLSCSDRRLCGGASGERPAARGPSRACGGVDEGSRAASAAPTPMLGRLRADALAEVERRMIREALERHGYNLSRAAAGLAVSRFGLRKRMQRLGLRLERALVLPAGAGPGSVGAGS